VRLINSDGRDLRFEAEDSRFTQGDMPTPDPGIDGHWWRQTYDPFSGRQALVAQKQERVPVLTTTIDVPNGTYELLVGSFTGDPANGIFGLGITTDVQPDHE
jgi:hypothetical protein